MGKYKTSSLVLASFIPLAFVFYGCAFAEPSASPWSIPTVAGNVATNPTPPASALGVLNWTAGLAIMGGLIAIVLSRGAMGLRAIVGGVALIITSYAINVYFHLIMIPVGIFLTVISGLWCYQIIVKAWRKNKC